jgi:hypothetical protein
MGLKTIIIRLFNLFYCSAGIHLKLHPENIGKTTMLFTRWESHAKGGQADVYPPLADCQGFAVKCYSFTLDALDLRYPRLLQR